MTEQLVEFRQSIALVDYGEAIISMENRVSRIYDDKQPELLWFLEHPPLYTAGTSAHALDLIDQHRFPVIKTGRGGKYTYHGPGQRVAYVLMNLQKRGSDVRKFIWNLEEWIIRALKQLDICGNRRRDRVGIWIVRRSGREEKIAAIGVRLRRWVSYHGIALNVNPNLEHYSGIIPCGLDSHGITSINDLGIDITMEDVDRALKSSYQEVFEVQLQWIGR